MVEPNYGGKIPNTSVYVKQFFGGDLNELWYPTVYVSDNIKINVLTPTVQKDIYIPRNIYIGGNIIQVPQATQTQTQTQENITSISADVYNTIMDLIPIQYTLVNDPLNTVYYGYSNNNVSPSYLETSPIIISKIQDLQNQIQDLQNQIQELQTQIQDILN